VVVAVAALEFHSRSSLGQPNPSQPSQPNQPPTTLQPYLPKTTRPNRAVPNPTESNTVVVIINILPAITIDRPPSVVHHRDKDHCHHLLDLLYPLHHLHTSSLSHHAPPSSPASC
jgi:hypothetical protein